MACSAADELRDLWIAARPEYKGFSDDGILIEEQWKTESPKIAFILKEPNDDFNNIRGHQFDPKKGNSRCFWRNINIWSFVVKKCFNDEAVDYREAIAQKERPVGHIAYVNLKKKQENRSTSSWDDIESYVERDWCFLERQLALVNPDVLFCCGTFKFISNRLKPVPVKIGETVHGSGNRIVIDFFHPSCRKGYEQTFELLKKMLIELNRGTEVRQ
jgi:hypothetical protein